MRLLRVNLERRNAKLADTVGRQAKMIERLRGGLAENKRSAELMQEHIANQRPGMAQMRLNEMIEEADFLLTETKP